MFHKVQAVQPLTGYRLLVQFEDGALKCYAVRPLLEKWAAFQALADVQGLWEQVKVDAGGYGVSWNDDIDLSCDELYHNGTEAPHE